MRSASRAAFSVGSAMASSNEFVWSDWVPPSTAASAWTATRTRLTSGCCAVSWTPAVCVWNRSISDFGFFAPNSSRITSAQIRRAARNFATSSSSVVRETKKNASRGANSSTSCPDSIAARTYSIPFAKREGDLLRRRRPGLRHVVAGDGDRVPSRHLLAAVREDVGDQPQRLLRRVDVGAAGDVLLEHVVLDGAGELLAADALALADELVEQHQQRRRGVDRHRGRHLVERDAVEQHPHVLDRVDRDADLADLAVCDRRVGVVAHLGRQVERHRQAGGASLDQLVVALVGLLGRAEAGVLPHRPRPAGVHRLVDAAGVGKGTRVTELAAPDPIRRATPGRRRARTGGRTRSVHSCAQATRRFCSKWPTSSRPGPARCRPLPKQAAGAQVGRLSSLPPETMTQIVCPGRRRR